MKRRKFIQCGMLPALLAPLVKAISREDFDRAATILDGFVKSKQINFAAVSVIHGSDPPASSTYQQFFGATHSIDSMFLLGSISKPICISALMSLFDRTEFKLDDPLRKFIPEFTGNGKNSVTLRHLLTHCSGLPDQLAMNHQLRSEHAPLERFVEHAIHTPLEFAAGTQYQYSSMGILLATHVAEIITHTDIRELVVESVFEPLQMKHSAQGMGGFTRDDVIPVQMEFAAPEAGAGDPAAKAWDWNSDYWRKLGAPWGGTQSSVIDVAKWMQEFLFARGTILKPETQQMMVVNQAPQAAHPARPGIQRRCCIGQFRLLRPLLWPHRLDGHAGLGRSSQLYAVRCAYLAARQSHGPAPASTIRYSHCPGGVVMVCRPYLPGDSSQSKLKRAARIA